MIRDDIIHMALEAGFDAHDMSDDFTCNLKEIVRFAELFEAKVRADERELLEALETLLALNENYSAFGGEIYRDRIDRAWDNARAVLKKARGEK
jgi:hypothetical protein